MPDGTQAESLSIAAGVEALTAKAPPLKEASGQPEERKPDDERVEATDVESELDAGADAPQADELADDGADDIAPEPDADQFDDEERYTIKVDGEDVEVSLDELKRNYSLEAASRKRMQEAAETRKLAEARSAEAEAQRISYAQNLQALQQQLLQADQQISPQYMAQLQEEDPVEWLVQKQAQSDRYAQLQQIQQEQQSILQQHLKAENDKLLGLVPEWKDTATRQRETAAIRDYAQSIGFTAEEISQASDARLVAMLRQAWRQHEISEGRSVAKKKVANAPKMAKSSARGGNADASANRRRAAWNRLQKDQSRESAVDYLLERKASRRRR